MNEVQFPCHAGQVRDVPSADDQSSAACSSGWHCFDDERVEPWDISNLAKECFGGKYTLPDLGQGTITSQVPFSRNASCDSDANVSSSQPILGTPGSCACITDTHGESAFLKLASNCAMQRMLPSLLCPVAVQLSEDDICILPVCSSILLCSIDE